MDSDDGDEKGDPPLPLFSSPDVLSSLTRALVQKSPKEKYAIFDVHHDAYYQIQLSINLEASVLVYLRAWTK